MNFTVQGGSKEFSWIMFGIIAMCALAVLYNVSDTVSTILNVIGFAVVTLLIVSLVAYLILEVYRSHQVLKGPISPDEMKENE